MENFGKRLKEERERLGMSQAKFAEGCNVGKTAQFTYEKGDRVPSLEYVDLAGKLGVDIQYLLRGEKTGMRDAREYGLFNILLKIESLLGIKKGEIESLNKKVLHGIDKTAWLYSQHDPRRPENQNKSDDDGWEIDVRNWLASATTPDICLDLELFTNVLTEVEATLERSAANLAPAKKSVAIVMLYRAFKGSGVIDQAIIQNAVKLAAS